MLISGFGKFYNKFVYIFFDNVWSVSNVIMFVIDLFYFFFENIFKIVFIIYKNKEVNSEV